METYIVRIYGRKTRKDREMIGVVELVGRDEKRVFSGPDELWGIIDPAGAVRSAPGKRAPEKKAGEVTSDSTLIRTLLRSGRTGRKVQNLDKKRRKP